MIKESESRIEIYRHHLKSCLEDMLNCYSDNVKNIDITITLNPDVEIPTVTYQAITYCTEGYKVPMPEKDVK